jgi:hypothetical protein
MHARREEDMNKIGVPYIDAVSSKTGARAASHRVASAFINAGFSPEDARTHVKRVSSISAPVKLSKFYADAVYMAAVELKLKNSPVCRCGCNRIAPQMHDIEYVGSMARIANMRISGLTSGPNLPPRYYRALRIYTDNIKAHPEVAIMTLAECADLGL